MSEEGRRWGSLKKRNCRRKLIEKAKLGTLGIA
jgi:hypothetical protein